MDQSYIQDKSGEQSNLDTRKRIFDDLRSAVSKGICAKHGARGQKRYAHRGGFRAPGDGTIRPLHAGFNAPGFHLATQGCRRAVDFQSDIGDIELFY